MKTILLILTIFSILDFGCSKSSSPIPGEPNQPAPEFITIKSNQTISNFPHKIDEYIPSNATSVIIFLHGGGGKKEGMAYNLGLKSNDSNNSYELSSSGSNWLLNNKVAAIFPQGQMVPGSLLSWTWNNYVMDSGEDDILFLQTLVDDIKNNPLFAKVSKFYLVGHSNGGMMTNRVWCESPSTFDGYAALAGPPSVSLSSSGVHTCHPSIFKPYLGIIGSSDSQLQTSGQMNSSTWTCSNYNSNNPAWVNGTVLNEKLYYTNRVYEKCGDTVKNPIINGQLSTYNDCSGTLQLIVVNQITVAGTPSGGDHCLLTINGNCTTTLFGSTGLDYKESIFSFLKQF